MKTRYIVILLLVVLALVSLTGCNGPADGLTPGIIFNPKDGFDYNNIPLDTAVPLKVTATNSSSHINLYQWTSRVVTSSGTTDNVNTAWLHEHSDFLAANQPETPWYSPSSWPPTVPGSSLNVTFNIYVGTLEGQHNALDVNVRVVRP